MAEKKTHQHAQIFETDKTAFKLTVWYNRKPNGLPWSASEMASDKNRKFHDSIDFIKTKNGYITRHDLALEKLVNHIAKHNQNIISALLFFNNQYEQTQSLIGKFLKNQGDTDNFIQPLFKQYPNGNVYVAELTRPPLEIYPLIHKKLTRITWK